MTPVSLVSAVATGLAVGLAARLTARGRALPVWLPPAVGIGAAMLATLVTWMADADRTGLTVAGVLFQVLAAVAAVSVVAATAERRPPAAGYRRPGETR